MPSPTELDLPEEESGVEKYTPAMPAQATVLPTTSAALDLPGTPEAAGVLASPALPPALSVVAVAPEVRRRKFTDTAAIRQNIYDRVLQAAQSLEPVSNQRHTLRLADVSYQDPEHVSKKQQKQAILNNISQNRRLRGTWELVDNETQEVIDRKAAVIARVPHFTERGTFISNGVEYALKNQQRLLPGVYTRRQANGDIESHINPKTGTGPAHRFFLDPEKGVFKIKVKQGTVGLLPLLKIMGVTNQELNEAWGTDLYTTNQKSDNATEYTKLRSKFLSAAELQQPVAEQDQRLREKFAKMELDPFVTQNTLGAPYANLSPQTVLAVTQKLAGVARGEMDTDDRDSLAYQQFLGPEDLFAERIQRDKGNIRRAALWRMSNKGNLKSMPTGLLTPQLQAALVSSGLGLALEEINPTEILDKLTSTTRLGEGGIASVDAIPAEARSVQPSMLGFIDPLRTPECYDRETEVMTRRGWVKWPDVVKSDEFACLIEGRLCYYQALQLVRQKYKGPMYGVDTGKVAYLVTPNHRIWFRPLHAGAQYRIATASECHDSPRRVCSGGFAPYLGDSVKLFNVPSPEVISNNIRIVDSVPIEDWAELVGWWLSEGSSYGNPEKGWYGIRISQCRASNTANCARIDSLLTRLPFKWSYAGDAYTLATKQLYSYFSLLGKQPQRYIPEELLRAPEAARQRLYEAMMLGDGRKNRSGVRTQFCSSSLQLAKDFERLAFSLGYASRVVFEPDDRPQSNTGGCWIAHVHKTNEHQIRAGLNKKHQCYTLDFHDEVFCARVPGGLLYVRRGDTVGHWSGNSTKVGIDVYAARGAMKGDDGKLYARFLDARTGEDVYKNPQQLAEMTIGFPGVLRSQELNVPAMRRGKMEWVSKDEIDVVVPNMEEALNPMSNLIPMKSQAKGQRMVMATRMSNQALPLVGAEAPLVQSAVPGTQSKESFESLYGAMLGAVRAEKPGQVMSVTADEMQVRYEDGSTETHELYNNFPFNRKTFTHQTPVLQPGDAFAAGQLLAKSNYTDNTGAAALGLNARTAYMARDNFEDAITISRSFADRLRSEHMYQSQLDTSDGRTIADKKKYVQAFPGTFDKSQLAKIDDNGMIRPGTEVQPGDPLLLGISPKVAAHNRVHKKSATSWSDASVTWDHSDAGVVTDTVMTNAGPLVVVKSYSDMQVGDKLCYDPETKLLTKDRGWVSVAEVTLEDQLATMNPVTEELEWNCPTHLHKYAHSGPMYQLVTKHLDMLVTPNHNLWAKERGTSAYRAVTAEELFNSDARWQFKKDMRWKGKEQLTFIFPRADREYLRKGQVLSQVAMDDWLEFLGFYIAEGWCYGGYVKIGQFRSSPHWATIKDLLDRIGLKWRYSEADGRFEIGNVWLADQLAGMGDSGTKQVPEFIQELTPRQIRIFLFAYLCGDGSFANTWEYSTSSEKLAYDVQLLCVKLGWSVRVVEVTRTDNWSKKRHWRGRINKKHLRPWRSKKHIETYPGNTEKMVPYEGTVHCVTVPNHILFVSRGGKTYLSLNSGRYG
jgi:hypothetical protein